MSRMKNLLMISDNPFLLLGRLVVNSLMSYTSTRPCNNYPQFELIHLNNSLHKFDIQFIKLPRWDDHKTRISQCTCRVNLRVLQFRNNPFWYILLHACCILSYALCMNFWFGRCWVNPTCVLILLVSKLFSLLSTNTTCTHITKSYLHISSTVYHSIYIHIVTVREITHKKQAAHFGAPL